LSSEGTSSKGFCGREGVLLAEGWLLAWVGDLWSCGCEESAIGRMVEGEVAMVGDCEDFVVDCVVCTEFDTLSRETVLKDFLVDGFMWPGSIRFFRFK